MKTVIFFLNLLDSINKRKIVNFFKSEKIEIDSLFDVGAHHGETVSLFNKNFKINKIFCFEVSLINYENLKKNLKKTKNVLIFNYGLGNKEGENTFSQLEESSSSTLVEINKNSKYFISKKKILNFFIRKDLEILSSVVKIRQLKNFMRENSVNSIDILKIDTEGYEFNVIKGAEEKIKNIKYIYFEHHFDDMILKNYKFFDIHKLLTSYGFKKIIKNKMFFRKSFEYVYENQKK